MARARNIKPGLYKNEDLAECSVWARYIFPGLWTLADREGRLEDRPKRIKAELLPFDTQDVEPLLRELAEKVDNEGVPFIVRYQNSDGRFIQISKFSKHQTPHYSEKASAIKPPPLQEIDPDSSGGNSGSNSCINGTAPPEHSEKSPPIKRGSQPPDSLILRLSDSPTPDSHDSPTSDSPTVGNPKRTAAPRPDWLPPEWEEYERHRIEKRSRLTPTAHRRCIEKLERWRTEGKDIAAILRHNIENGYTGLFEPNGGGNGAHRNKQEALESRNKAAMQHALEHPHGSG